MLFLTRRAVSLASLLSCQHCWMIRLNARWVCVCVCVCGRGFVMYKQAWVFVCAHALYSSLDVGLTKQLLQPYTPRWAGLHVPLHLNARPNCPTPCPSMHVVSNSLILQTIYHLKTLVCEAFHTCLNLPYTPSRTHTTHTLTYESLHLFGKAGRLLSSTTTFFMSSNEGSIGTTS